MRKKREGERERERKRAREKKRSEYYGSSENICQFWRYIRFWFG
jgi:hypothetical protein